MRHAPLLAALLLAAPLVAVAQPGAPLNDDFWTAEPIAGAGPFTLTGSNVDATRAITEPESPAGCTTDDGNNSVYWTFAATQDGAVTIDLAGSTFDTVLNVYRRTVSGPGYESVGCNDDAAVGVLTSAIAVDVVAEGLYMIRVTGWAGEAGDISLDVQGSDGVFRFPPDDILRPENLTLQPGFVHAGSNVGASSSPDDPAVECASGSGLSGSNSVWRQYLGSAAGTLTVDTDGSDFDTILAVFREDGSLVTCNDDGPGLSSPSASSVSFEVEPQVKFFVQVVGYRNDATSDAAEGRIVYNVSFEATPPTSAEADPGPALRLVAPVPNPTAGPVRLEATLAEATDVRVEVFDALGRRVALVHDGPAAGEAVWTWDPGAQPAGVYVVRLATRRAVRTQRVTVGR